MLRDIETKEYPLEHKRGGYTVSVGGRSHPLAGKHISELGASSDPPVDAYEWAKAEYKRLYGDEPANYAIRYREVEEPYDWRQVYGWVVDRLTYALGMKQAPRIRFAQILSDEEADAGQGDVKKFYTGQAAELCGWFDSGSREVWLRTDRGWSDQIQTLAHEFRHCWQLDNFGSKAMGSDRAHIEEDADAFGKKWREYYG